MPKKALLYRLLVSLAVCDGFFLLIQFVNVFRNFGFHRELHLIIFPYFTYPFSSITLYSSAFTTVTIGKSNSIRISLKPFTLAYERYCSTVLNKRQEHLLSRTYVYVLVPIVIGFLVSFPKFFDVEIKNFGDQSFISASELRTSEEYTYYYVGWFMTIASGILPMAAIIYCYWKV